MGLDLYLEAKLHLPPYSIELAPVRQAIAQARELDEQRGACGLNRGAMDESARRGFANGAFEALAEDVPKVVEAFYPEGVATSAQKDANPRATA